MPTNFRKLLFFWYVIVCPDMYQMVFMVLWRGVCVGGPLEQLIFLETSGSDHSGDFLQELMNIFDKKIWSLKCFPHTF